MGVCVCWSCGDAFIAEEKGCSLRGCERESVFRGFRMAVLINMHADYDEFY